MGVRYNKGNWVTKSVAWRCRRFRGDFFLNSFLSYCPTQNPYAFGGAKPYEDIWLQAKTWVRRFCALIPTFSHLKWMFECFIRHTTFDFTSLQMYGVFSKIK
jgi:hypothetical protein